jgi:tetratricopeptide (TPR) repeat protein
MSGEDSRAAHYFELAGQQARALFANAEALRHFRTALEVGHPDPLSLHEAIGDLQTLLGDYGAALTSYETAAALCGPSVLGHIEHKLGTVHHRLGAWDLADSYFEAARDSYGEEDTSPERARLYGDWSLNAHRKGDPQGALGMALRAVEIAQAANDTGAVAQAHNILGVLARSRADFDEAFKQLEMSLKLAETLRDPSERIAVLNNLALARSDAGDYERAIEVIGTALDLCTSQGDRHREAALHNNLADMLHASGRSDDAMAHLTQAVTIFAEIGVDSGALHPEIWKLVEW